MTYANIIKKLSKDGFQLYEGEFAYKPVAMVTGTAIINLVDDEVVECEARYADVVKQIEAGKSHILTIETIKGCKKKALTPYKKYGA